MTKTGNEQEKHAADHPALDPTRPSRFSDMPYFSEALSLNPLLAHPAAAMAAATAIGFGFANQMAGAFFGALQSAMETTNRQNAQASEPEAAAETEASVAAETMVAAGAVAAEPAAPAEKAKPVRKAPPAKPVAEKKAVAKAAPAKAPEKAEVKAQPAPKAAAKAPARPKVSKVAAGSDDLKRISGIGPKLEGILKGMGVTSLAEVAAWTDKDIARFDKELGFEGRIGRDDWVGQAKALLK
ncbi:5' DNA nuclease [Rhizobium terrae]|uniref:5' DNA nuclease n=1 Tax=Rhizobium terrae TaxID=2171756 RepID=UPI000E3E0E09|nr:5' DNA nuclease [Rhizobium terrae]